MPLLQKAKNRFYKNQMIMSMKDMSNVKTFHYLYKIIFLCGYPTGRYYLGKRTYRGLNMNNDPYHGSGKFCKAYFKKYGAIYGETYIKEIIEINPSWSINRDREKILIGNLWETDSLCMNQCPGGMCGPFVKGHEIKESTRKKIAAALGTKILQYDLNGNFIKEWPSAKEISRKCNIDISSITNCCKRRIKTSIGFLWRFKTDPLTDTELKELHKYDVLKFDLMGNYVCIYSSITEAAKSNNVSCGNISECCNLKRRSIGGFTYRFQKDLNTNNRILVAEKKYFKPVDCYTLSNVYIKTYPTISEASVEMSGNKCTGAKNIKKCCEGKKDSAYGYKWKFKDEF